MQPKKRCPDLLALRSTSAGPHAGQTGAPVCPAVPDYSSSRASLPAAAPPAAPAEPPTTVPMGPANAVPAAAPAAAPPSAPPAVPMPGKELVEMFRRLAGSYGTNHPR